MEFKIVDDFLSKEELEKIDNRDFSEDIREAEKNGTISSRPMPPGPSPSACRSA